MAAPTQQYPPWLEPTLVTVDRDGSAVLETSVRQLPQTYYGPSIPLGTNWVYGGSTFPASIATSFSATSTPEPSTPTSPLPSTSPSTLPPTSILPLTSPSTLPPTSTLPSTSPATLPPSSQIQITASSPLSSTTPTSSSSFAANPSFSSRPKVSSKASGPSGTLLAIIISIILGVVLMILLLVVRLRGRTLRRHALVRGRGITWSVINESLSRRDAEAREREEGEGAEREGAEGEGAEGEGAEGERTAFLGGERVMQQHHQGPASFYALSNVPRDRPAVSQPLVIANRSQPASRKSDSSTMDSDAKRDDIARFNESSSTPDSGSLFFNGGDDREGGISRHADEATGEDAAGSARVGESSRSYSGDYAPRPPGAAAPRVPSLMRLGSQIPSPPIDDDTRYEGLYGRTSLEGEGLLPPPRRDADTTRNLQPRTYPDSPPSEADERATLLTAAHRGASPPGSPVHASPAEKEKFEELPTSPTLEEIEMEQGLPRRSVSPARWSGLTELAKGLGRLSWFRRMESGANPSGTRHSSPSRSRRGTESRPTSATGMPSPRLRPPFGARPQSGVSFRSIDAELGLRPPGMRLSAAGSGTGSGSGKSGASVYHSASSRPRTPLTAVGDRPISTERPYSDVGSAILYIPPGVDLGLAEGTTTVRAIDLLDLPVPEPALPFDRQIAPEGSSRSARHSTTSSKGTTGTGLAFPPGLVSVTKWDSNSGSFTRDVRDVLEEAPPQAGGEWSSLRSKKSTSDVGEEEADPDQQSEGLVTRSSTEGQSVQVVAGEHTASETASIVTSPRAPAPEVPTTSMSSRSPRGFGITLTPRVSSHELAPSSDAASHSANGSYSSQRSHPASHSHSQAASHHSSNRDSEDGGGGGGGGHRPASPPPGTGFNRASLTAIGGEAGGGPLQMSPPPPPPLLLLRRLSAMPPMVEDRESSESSYSNPAEQEEGGT